MRHSADAVIIGGGVMGASAAYHLAMRGCLNVVLLEARSLAAGGTGHSGAIVRQHYSQDVTTLLALHSVEMFERFESLTGRAGIFHQTGWIKLGSPDAVEAMARNASRHRELGVEVKEILPEDLGGFIPDINVEGIGAALFEPRGGYADPVGTTQGFAEKARQLGAAVMEGVRAVNIRVEGSRVVGVETDSGLIETQVVVNAAGPWGAKVASWAGLETPITVTREQDVLLRCDKAPDVTRYAVSDGVDRIYWRPYKGNVLLVGDGHPKDVETADPDEYNPEADGSFREMIMERLRVRFPGPSEGFEIVGGYASLYDTTPDWHPLIGRDSDLSGYVHCNGFSGHGFKLGPAVGKVVAEEILDSRAHTIDISSLRPGRFRENALLEGSYAGNQA